MNVAKCFLKPTSSVENLSACSVKNDYLVIHGSTNNISLSGFLTLKRTIPIFACSFWGVPLCLILTSLYEVGSWVPQTIVLRVEMEASTTISKSTYRNPLHITKLNAG